MQLIESARKVSAEVPMSFFNFKRFEKQCGDFVFIDARINFKDLEKVKGEKIVYFEIEEPNRFSTSNADFRREKYESYFYKILDVCPYTTEWLNKLEGTERRQFVFFPFDTSVFPAQSEKIYDVVYFGGIHSREIMRIVKTISKFNYRFMAQSEDKIYKIVQNTRVIRKIKKILNIPTCNDKYLTNKDVTNKEKLKLISQSKITIVHNLLFENARSVRQIQKVKDFKGNGAFVLIPEKSILRSIYDFIFCKEYIVPQQKTRLFEAAFCKSLILCRRDEFNIVEKFFTPNKDFIYYEEGKLEEKISDVLANYSNYTEMIENAYQKAIKEYTTDVFFEKYLKNLK